MNDIGLFAIEKIERLSALGFSAFEIQGMMELVYPVSLIEKYVRHALPCTQAAKCDEQTLIEMLLN